jgi:hypothetical protein
MTPSFGPCIALRGGKTLTASEVPLDAPGFQPGRTQSPAAAGFVICARLRRGVGRVTEWGARAPRLDEVMVPRPREERRPKSSVRLRSRIVDWFK